MILTLLVHAPQGDVFADGCFDGQLNNAITVRQQSGSPSWSGLLLRYAVVAEGRAVELTLDMDGDAEVGHADGS